MFDVFFFKQKTAYELRISDWSSDVCSSDLAYPVASRHSRNGPANIIQRLKELGRNGMRTIFIAHDRHDRNFRVAGHPSLIVRFAEKSVHPFQHALCYTRRLTKPARRTDHTYIGGQDQIGRVPV